MERLDKERPQCGANDLLPFRILPPAKTSGTKEAANRGGLLRILRFDDCDQARALPHFDVMAIDNLLGPFNGVLI